SSSVLLSLPPFPTRRSSDLGHAVLSYLFALVAMLFTASSYGVMAGSFPKAGSTYSYTSQAIHPNVGFVAGWAILLDYLMMPILLDRKSTRLNSSHVSISYAV